jgi:hypothetical protein
VADEVPDGPTVPDGNPVPISAPQVDAVLPDYLLGDNRKAAAALILSFADVFSGLPPGLPPQRAALPAHRIDLFDEAARLPHRKKYRLSVQETAEVNSHVQKLLAAGFIRPSESEACAPIVFVEKRDGAKRMCIDYRDLNALTRKNKYPLPLTEEVLDRVNGSTVFSKLDLEQGYHQIPMFEPDIHKTAFATPMGHFEWTVLPFGLCNGVATFQTMIDRVFARLRRTEAYVDDVLIHDRSFDDHVASLERALRRLRDAKLYAKLSKCQFFVSSTTFLGHVLSAEGILPDPSKVDAIRSWPTPSGVREVRQFLGLSGYYRKFMKGYAHIAGPLNDLLRDDATWEWSPAAHAAFDALRSLLAAAPLLLHPNLNLPFILETDASATAIGGVLSQDQGRGPQPVAYYSLTLDATQRNYAVHDRELLALVTGAKKWRWALLSCPPFHWRTDHAPLNYITLQKNISPRQARWLEYLSQFSYTMEYVKGANHLGADALSRLPALAPILAPPGVGPRRRGSDVQHTTLFAITEGSMQPPPVGVQRPVSPVAPAVWRADIIRALTTDPVARDGRRSALHPDLAKRNGWVVHEDLLFHDGKCFIPDVPYIRATILHEVHAAPDGGHQGQLRSAYRFLESGYYWPKWRSDLNDYIRTCVTCQINKPLGGGNPHTTQGVLNNLPVPERPWESVSMDFIVGLPPSGPQKFDAIFTIVCRKSKMPVFLPCHVTLTARGAAELFFDAVYCVHGLPRSIVSDRDTKFTSRFWTALLIRIGTALRLTHSFHPQGNGQAEYMNKMVEGYLRAFTTHRGAEWTKWLPHAQFVLSTSVSRTTGVSPFYMVYGRHAITPLALSTPAPPSEPTATTHFVNALTDIWAECTTHALETRAVAEKYLNTGRTEARFPVGSYVLLDRAYRSPGMKLPKMGPKHDGPFKILAQVGSQSYTLELPQSWRMHPTVWAGRLTAFHGTPPSGPAHSGASSWPAPIETVGPLGERAQEWEVERILDHRDTGRGRKYYIEWVGGTRDDRSWEPQSCLTNCKELLQEYLDMISTVTPSAAAPPSGSGHRRPKRSAGRPTGRTPGSGS